MRVVQMYARMKAHTPMKMSMKIFTVVVVPRIQPASYFTPFAAAAPRYRDSVIAPLATAAPSVLTARPIHAAATMGWLGISACATNGRTTSSTTAKITTSDETMMGTTGRARIALPVAIAADTPQIEMPEASGAAHSRLNLKYFRAT